MDGVWGGAPRIFRFTREVGISLKKRPKRGYVWICSLAGGKRPKKGPMVGSA